MYFVVLFFIQIGYRHINAILFLFQLYNTFPNDPLEFMRQSLGIPVLKTIEVEILERKLKLLEDEKEILKLENSSLQNKLQNMDFETTPTQMTSVANSAQTKQNDSTAAVTQVIDSMEKLAIIHPSKKDIQKAVRNLSYDLTKVNGNGNSPETEVISGFEETKYEEPENQELKSSEPESENPKSEEPENGKEKSEESKSKELETKVARSDDSNNNIGQVEHAIDADITDNNKDEAIEKTKKVDTNENEDIPVVSEAEQQELHADKKCDMSFHLQDTQLPPDSDDEDSQSTLNETNGTKECLDAIEKNLNKDFETQPVNSGSDKNEDEVNVDLDKSENEVNFDSDKIKSEDEVSVDSDRTESKDNTPFSTPSKNMGVVSSMFVSPTHSTASEHSSVGSDEEPFAKNASFHSVEDDEEETLLESNKTASDDNDTLKLNVSYSTSSRFLSDDPELSFLLNKSI